MRTSDELSFLSRPRFRKRRTRSAEATHYLEAIENLWPDMDAAAQYASDHLAEVQNQLSDGEYEAISSGILEAWVMGRAMRDHQERLESREHASPE